MPGLWRKRTRKPFTPVEQVRGSTHGSKQSTRGAVDPTEVLDNAGGRRAEWLRTALMSGRFTPPKHSPAGPLHAFSSP
jgi:hypothetical protein